MTRSLGPYLVLASVAINLAFAAVWLAHAAPALLKAEPAEERAVWCPLHRDLGVTAEQWERIEPRLREFQTSVGELCREVDLLRSEVLELVAAERPDTEAIELKQEEILSTKRAIQRLVVEHLLAEKQSLTSSQQAKLFELLRRRTECGANPPMSGRGSGQGKNRSLRAESDSADSGRTP
jgi:Spy/CpxP family protein refolding chaperone